MFQPNEDAPKIHILNQVKQNISKSVCLHEYKTFAALFLQKQAQRQKNSHFQTQNAPGKVQKLTFYLLKTTFKKFILKDKTYLSLPSIS